RVRIMAGRTGPTSVGPGSCGYSLPRHPEWHDEVNHYDGRVHQGLATTAPRSGA
ncbi:TPA: hypothetical protein LZR67_004698, partial [Escherichia coli]|nr:hypothetical protein [Escherichia coli]